MGWWKLRPQVDAMTDINRHVGTARIGLMSGNIEFMDGREISRLLISDLPTRIEGKGSRDRNPTIQMLEDAFPGISDALYEWFEPRSTGELLGELLSSWGGARRYEVTKESQKDGQGSLSLPDPSAPIDRDSPRGSDVGVRCVEEGEADPRDDQRGQG